MSGGVSDVVIEDLVGTGEMGIDVKSGKGRGGYIRNGTRTPPARPRLLGCSCSVSRVVRAVTFRRFRQVFGHTKCTAEYCGDIAPRSYGDGSEGWIQLEPNGDDCGDCPDNCNCSLIPQVHDIRFEDLHAEGNKQIDPGQLQCLPEAPCTGVVFDDVRYFGNRGDGGDQHQPGAFRCSNVQGTARGFETGTRHFEAERPIAAVCSGELP